MIGDRVGNYRILRSLGKGGMGEVYVAEHELLGKEAAVKMLLPEWSQDEGAVRRFFNEARAATRVKHPAIVDVYDFGYHEDGSAYIVMELLEGEALTPFLERNQRLSEAVAAELTRQIAEALGAAHDIGVIHRDLKPDNVFLVADSAAVAGLRVKLLDFGIAKLANQMAGPASARTLTGVFIGTPTYASPEQCSDPSSIDYRSDIYSLGCLFYEMLTGAPPFSQSEASALMTAHLLHDPAPPRASTPSLSPAIEGLLGRMLAKDPSVRPPSMAEISRALARPATASVSPPAAPTAVGGALGPAPAEEAAAPPPDREQPTTLTGGAAEVGEQRRRRGAGLPLAVSGAVALALGLSLAFFIERGGEEDRGGGKPAAAEKGSPETDAPASSPAERPEARPAPDEQRREASAGAGADASLGARVSIKSKPAGAAVLRGDEQLGVTPFSKVFRRGDEKETLVLRRDGYRDRRLEIDLSSNSEHDVLLKPRAESEADYQRRRRRRARARARRQRNRARSAAEDREHRDANPKEDREWGELIEWGSSSSSSSSASSRERRHR